MNKLVRKSLYTAMFGSLALLSACGGSSSSDDDPAASTPGNITAGIITGFGSIYVNGIKFETDNAGYDVDDDNAADESDLRVGMYVRINGKINADGKTGTATMVKYENELEGPVSAIPSAYDAATNQITVTILGKEVVINGDTTIDDDHGLTIDTIKIGDILEVSGNITSTGIVATHIEKQDDSDTEFEIKGTITAVGSNQFTIDGTTDVAYDSNTEFDDIANDTPAVDMYVEVEGEWDSANNRLIASKVEAEDEGLGEDDADEVEIEGAISNYNGTEMTFEVQGQKVDASATPQLIPASLVLADDLKVEVEGDLVDGVLIAEEIKVKGRKIKLQAEVASVDSTAGTLGFSLFGGTDNVTVRVNQQTEMEDDTAADQDPLTLDHMTGGDFVELEAFDDGSGDINAIQLKRKDSDSVVYKAPLESFDATTSSITLFGQSFDLSSVANFEYEENDVEISTDAATFFGMLETGDMVKLVDDDQDNVIDKAELDD